jgi:hypothetical protein
MRPRTDTPAQSRSPHRNGVRMPLARMRSGTAAPREPPCRSAAWRCRRKFLRFFPDGFTDATYIAWERGYKWDAHRQWERKLDGATYRALLRSRDYAEIAARAVGIEARTHLIFSFEKMGLRDAVRPGAGARAFAQGLYDFLNRPGEMERKFDRWCAVVANLPRKQSRVSTWPIVTVFGFIAQPDIHIFLSPTSPGARRTPMASRSTTNLACRGGLCQPARLRRDGARRPRRPQSARHDRHPVLPLGAGSDEYAE